MYKRVLLKLSGELFASEGEVLASNAIKNYANAISEARGRGQEVAVVVGGGNIIRGRSASSFLNRAEADSAGMLATAINAIFLKGVLSTQGIDSIVVSSFSLPAYEHNYSLAEAKEALSEGRIAIFAGGSGLPYFSTDTAAAIRAADIEAEALLKGTKHNGVYEKDPAEFTEAKKIDKISYGDFIKLGLKAMDSSSIEICMNLGVEVLVFQMNKISDALSGKAPGTLIR